MTATDIVQTSADAAAAAREPLLVLDPLRRFLDAHGIGAGDLAAEPIGAGHSNVTYRVRRDDGTTVVVRRPPRGPLQPSTHDMLREARVIAAVGATGVRVPEVVAVCADVSVIGAPFYVMPYVEGCVLGDAVPAVLEGHDARERIAFELVDALAEIHAVGYEAAGLQGLGRPGGYLERQLRRFASLWQTNATRALPEVDLLTAWLEASIPAGGEVTVVHGDFRLGNVMYAPEGPARLVAVLDWEMAALGDPLADLGYLIASYARPGDDDSPLFALSPVTRERGFPERTALVERYARHTGRATDRLPFYELLAMWKAAIFLEGNYKRFRSGTTDDAWYASLEQGVPALARAAWARAEAVG